MLSEDTHRFILYIRDRIEQGKLVSEEEQEVARYILEQKIKLEQECIR